MSFFGGKVDKRELAYGHLALSMLGTIREAVQIREANGETRAEIARRIGIDRSQLSRTLNGRIKNLTLRSVSDILFATGHSLRDPIADPWEKTSQQWTRNGPDESSDVFLSPISTIITVGNSYPIGDDRIWKMKPPTVREQAPTVVFS